MTSIFTRQDPMNDPSGDITVDFLLPTGILIPLPCKGTQTLEAIKDMLWAEAANLPLFNNLRQPEWYTLVFVNKKAEQEECLDESGRLCDIKMYKPLFKVVEKKGDQEEKMLSTKIGWLIGKCLREFETLRDPEVNDFRISMIEQCRNAVVTRNNYNWEEMVVYCYPPDIESNSEVSSLVQDRLSPQVGIIMVKK